MEPIPGKSLINLDPIKKRIVFFAYSAAATAIIGGVGLLIYQHRATLYPYLLKNRYPIMISLGGCIVLSIALAILFRRKKNEIAISSIDPDPAFIQKLSAASKLKKEVVAERIQNNFNNFTIPSLKPTLTRWLVAEELPLNDFENLTEEEISLLFQRKDIYPICFTYKGKKKIPFKNMGEDKDQDRDFLISIGFLPKKFIVEDKSQPPHFYEFVYKSAAHVCAEIPKTLQDITYASPEYLLKHKERLPIQSLNFVSEKTLLKLEGKLRQFYDANKGFSQSPLSALLSDHPFEKRGLPIKRLFSRLKLEEIHFLLDVAPARYVKYLGRHHFENPNLELLPKHAPFLDHFHFSRMDPNVLSRIFHVLDPRQFLLLSNSQKDLNFELVELKSLTRAHIEFLFPLHDENTTDRLQSLGERIAEIEENLNDHLLSLLSNEQLSILISCISQRFHQWIKK